MLEEKEIKNIDDSERKNINWHEIAPESILLAKLRETLSIKHVLKYCCCQWKERIGTNTSTIYTTDVEVMTKRLKDIQDQNIGNYVKLYPWFSNMQSHFCIAHAHFLSIFDIASQHWTHSEFLDSKGRPDPVIGGFRHFDKAHR